MKVTRTAPGFYRAVQGEHGVQILKNAQLRGSAKWVAYAEWDRYTVTDPVETFAEAKRWAQAMLNEVQQ